MKHWDLMRLLCCGIVGLGVLFAGGDVRGQQASGKSVKVTIDPTKILHSVSENEYHGINLCALWNDTCDDPGAVKAFAQMGMQILRFPGGVPAQWYDWKEPLATGWTPLTPERVAAMAKAGGAGIMFQTNTATDKTDTSKDTGKQYTFNSSGEHAAGWVKWCKKQKIKVAFWEIGNEPEMDAPGEHKHSQEAIFAWYNKKFGEQVKAMKKVDPKARCLGPSSTNTYFWWACHNIKKFLKAHGNKQGSGLVDAISLHWYFSGKSWDAGGKGGAQSWQAQMNYINSAIKEYDTRDLDVYITEWNWGGGMDNHTARKYFNGLGCADIVGAFLRSGIAGHTHFVFQKVEKGWGVLSTKNDYRAENSPAPTYFALLMAAKLSGKVLEAKPSVDEKTVLSAYATMHKDKSLQIMLINKSGDNLDVEVSCGAYKLAGKKANVYTLKPTNDDVNSEDVIYNGVESPKPGEVDLPKPESIKCKAVLTRSMSPYSMHVITVGGTGRKKGTATRRRRTTRRRRRRR